MISPGRHPAIPSPKEREMWLRELKNHREALFNALFEDTGKDPEESFLTEWSAIESTFRFLDSELDEFTAPQEINSAFDFKMGRRWVQSRRIPWGKVLVIGTWNYPVALHLSQMVNARALGNQVAFKASPSTPNLGKVLSKLLHSLWGDAFEYLDDLENEQLLKQIRANRYQLVVFTGGTRAAAVIGETCGRALVPFIAEASGSEVAIVLKNAELRSSLDHLFWCAFQYMGQTCVAPRFAFIPQDMMDAAWRLSGELLSSIDEKLSPLLPKAKAEHEQWCRWLVTECGGVAHPLVQGEQILLKVPSIQTLKTSSPPTFGPGLVFVPYRDLSEVVEWIQLSPWSLMTTVFGRADPQTLGNLNKLDASIVSFNEGVISAGDAAVPMGGRGSSGLGICHGHEGWAQLSRPQTWVDVKAWPGSESVGFPPRWSKIKKTKSFIRWARQIEEKPLEILSFLTRSRK